VPSDSHEELRRAIYKPILAYMRFYGRCGAHPRRNKGSALHSDANYCMTRLRGEVACCAKNPVADGHLESVILKAFNACDIKATFFVKVKDYKDEKPTCWQSYLVELFIRFISFIKSIVKFIFYCCKGEDGDKAVLRRRKRMALEANAENYAKALCDNIVKLVECADSVSYVPEELRRAQEAQDYERAQAAFKLEFSPENGPAKRLTESTSKSGGAENEAGR
jgi:hypothetical protein